jgi:hypothetical protein
VLNLARFCCVHFLCANRLHGIALHHKLLHQVRLMAHCVGAAALQRERKIRQQTQQPRSLVPVARNLLLQAARQTAVWHREATRNDYQIIQIDDGVYFRDLDPEVRK